MALALVTVFADQAGEMQIRQGQVYPQFFPPLAAGAGVGGFPRVHVQFAPARAPEPAIGLLRSFEQQHLVTLVKTIEQRRNLVGQGHFQKLRMIASQERIQIKTRRLLVELKFQGAGARA